MSPTRPKETAMILNLTEHASEPMHRQLSHQLRGRILDGTIAQGTPLLPRTLARQHRISVVTVQRAVDELSEEGLMTHTADGRFAVSEVAPDLRRELTQRQLVETMREEELSPQELALARDIQCRLLPPPRLDADGWTVVARNEPARFVAGDFYDLLRQADGTVDLVVADVAGKGIGPSLIMASFKAVLPFLTRDRSVVDVARELNRKLCHELGRREFIAFALARFHPASGRLQVVNAGMPDPYLLRLDRFGRRRIEVLEVPGERLPLGLRREVTYRASSVTLNPGERLLLLSDGLPEASTDGGEPLGYRALADLLTASWKAAKSGDDSEAWLDAFLETIRRQTAVMQDDDWTALILERRR